MCSTATTPHSHMQLWSSVMEVLLLIAGLLVLLCAYATLRCISRNALPTHSHPIQATGQDSSRVITMVTPTKTYFFQQCTAVDQTETSVQETDSNASAEIVMGLFNNLYLPKWLCWLDCGMIFVTSYKCQFVTLQSFVIKHVTFTQFLKVKVTGMCALINYS